MSNSINQFSASTAFASSAHKRQRSLFSSVCSATGKAIAMPFRLASTAVNGGVFAAYYVTTLATSGLAAVGGTIFGMVDIANDAAQGRPHKKLSDYTVTAARETFNFISNAYYKLPKHGAEIIFTSAVVVAVTTLAIMAGAEGGGSSGGSSGVCHGHLWLHSPHYCCAGNTPHSSERIRPEDDYNPSGITAALHPYRPAIVLGRKIMGKTTDIVNRGQEID
ncbi:hypothetical protein [Endozoicomonas sp. ONNA2]|uniref:hypothetical protein n=1 Tax=Endozoicomonas sp. ONNA2 TaxID=2828741 RepID=UPI002148D79C|nr:hypothetical protein [Endozoicomonas sp. ONNA2]